MDVKATLTNDMENIVSKTMIISVAAIICMGGRQSNIGPVGNYSFSVIYVYSEASHLKCYLLTCIQDKMLSRSVSVMI